MKQNLIIGINEKPKKSLWALLSIQHVFAMFGATILVPMLTGLSISVALFCSGIGTLIYILCTKAKVPVYLGSSFAYIAVIQSVSGFGGENVNYGGVMTGLLAVGLIYVILSLLVHFFGKSWINKILPPVVIGPAIMIIGLGLASSAIGNAHMVGSFKDNWKYIIVALIAMGTVIGISVYAKGFPKVIPFLIAIVVGFIFAAIFQIVDFKPVVEVLKHPSQWFRIPNFSVLGWKNTTGKFLGTTFTMHKPELAAILTIAPLAFVTACEHIGDHSVLGKVCDKDFLQDPGLDKTLLGDGLATGFAALVGGPANTTYGENTSVIGMTKVGSVWVTGLAAIIAICLSFCNIITTLIAAIPACVMGGMSIILYGFIGLNGIRVLMDNKINLAKSTNLIIVSVMLVLGLGGATLEIGKLKITSVAIAVIFGVILNAIFNATNKHNTDDDNLEVEMENDILTNKTTINVDEEDSLDAKDFDPETLAEQDKLDA